MKCTKEAKAALDLKGVKDEQHDLTMGKAMSFAYTKGASQVWDWLHCTYPDDKAGENIMHSYVFIDGEFIGEGFAAADKIKSGKYDAKLHATGAAQSCEERYPNEASVVKHYMDNSANKVLLFGWLDCPCTGVAQSRFAASSICYESRTWANPDSELMTFLQCKTGKPNDHSFVYFRKGGVFTHVGNGFELDEKAMTPVTFNELVKGSEADTKCQQASVARNLYGTPLEECRAQSSDMHGSWMDDGKCTELSGGVHQVCIEKLTADFSEQTHQSAWSKGRAGMRHCVCVGAWSLYMTDEAKHQQGHKDIMPHCSAIPETALTERYLSHWKTWNGFPADVVKGVNELVQRCLKQAEEQPAHAEMLKCGLKQRFEGMHGKVAELTSATELVSLRKKLSELECKPAA